MIIDPRYEKLIPLEKATYFKDRLSKVTLAEEKEKYEGSLSEFVRGAWSSIDSSEFQNCWVLDAMCDHLEAVTLGSIKRLLINVPPRCSKTTIVSILYPIWTWCRSDISYLSGPQVRFLCASYSDKLSLDNSNKSRRLLFSPWFQKYWPDKIVLQSDQNTKGKFDNTLGGSRQATSVGGGLLGLGGDILIGDDLNNTEVVESEAEREQVKTFWNEFKTTRLNNQREGAIVVVQQRTHVSDVSGLILDEDKTSKSFIHLMVPMRFEPRRSQPTIILPQYGDSEPWRDPRTYEGELMWPERFNEEEVRDMEIGLSVYMAAGRLQQSPVPKGGGIIKREWWLPWDEVEAQRYGLEWHGGRKEFPDFELVGASIDTAFGEKEENDYSACTVWGVWLDKARNRRAMLMYAWAVRKPLHGRVIEPIAGEAPIQYRERQKAEWGLIELIADTCKRYKVKRLLIEDKTRGRDVAQEIRRLYARENWGIELINPVKDKVTRAHSVVPLFTDGVVYAPDTRWAEAVINECALLPKGEHDDLCDSAVQFLLWARENEVLVRGDESSAALEDQMQWHPKQPSVADQYGV